MYRVCRPGSLQLALFGLGLRFCQPVYGTSAVTLPKLGALPQSLI